VRVPDEYLKAGNAEVVVRVQTGALGLIEAARPLAKLGETVP